MSSVRVKACRHGLFCFFPHDIYIGASLDQFGVYSEEEVELFTRLLKPGMRVVEVGANIGAHTVPLAKIVGETGRVFAFEPQRVIYQQLCANLAMNGLFHVWAWQEAVGNSEHETFRVPSVDYAAPGNFGGVELTRPDGEPAAEYVQLNSLDSMGLQPHFIKIDCEGMELDVIEGAKKEITKHRPVIYCENDRAHKSAALIDALMRLGYKLYWHFPKVMPHQEGDKAIIVSSNMLCIPAELSMTVSGLRAISGPDDWGLQ